MPRENSLSVTLSLAIIFILFVGVLPALGDRLYKGRRVTAVGYGNEKAGSISWADCSRKALGPFKKPPYWFSQGDDCKIHARFFGLGVENGTYVALNLETLREFFPEASNKDKYSFEEKKDGTIVISQNGKTLTFPPELTSALVLVEAIAANSEGLFTGPTPQLQTEFLDAQSAQGPEALKAILLSKVRLPERTFRDGALLGFALEDYESATQLIGEGLRSSPKNKHLLLARGLVDYARGLYSTAFQDFSDVSAEATTDTRLSAALQANRALTILRTGQTQSAEHSLKESADLFQQVGATDEAVYLTALVADVLRDRGRLQEAEGVLERTLKLAKDLGPTEEARLLRQRAQLVFLRGNTREAESLVQMASTIHSRVGSILDLGEDLELAAEIKAELHSFPEALEPLEKAQKAFLDARYLRGQGNNRLMMGEVFAFT